MIQKGFFVHVMLEDGSERTVQHAIESQNSVHAARQARDEMAKVIPLPASILVHGRGMDGFERLDWFDFETLAPIARKRAA